MRSHRRAAVFIIFVLLFQLLCTPVFAIHPALFDDDGEAEIQEAPAEETAEEPAVQEEPVQDFVVYAENTLLPSQTEEPDDDTFYVLDAEELSGLVQQFMKLTTEEAAAINCHMGFSDGSAATVRDVSNAYQQFPLAWITHVADEAATFLLER